ncbi:MAG: 2,3,4,5-tetrahydropyridine-2,6-carboxylate N-succinyltransferase [Rhodobacteraceae bacterium]|nr:2,3,4,5-tetrahydropyridine-2,6-carboxylate N-succinyltransferase [Paracoccaceae bacterium]
MPQASELPIDTSATADEMAEAMFGSGIEIISADYDGAGRASGIYSDGDEVAPELTPGDTGVILSTGKAKDITNSSGEANTRSNTTSNNRTSGDEDLDEMSGVKTYDAAVFEATFVPQGEVLTMQVTFSSEEYLEYVNSGFNDAVGIWVNGEPAELMVGDGDITINNINDQSNSNLYIDNPANAEVANTEMDGFTVTLTLKAPVEPDQENTIKIAIADGGDRSYDSNLLIAGDSIQTALIAEDDTVDVNGSDPKTVDVLANDASTVSGTLTITHINGQAVSAGDTVTLASGEQITLNPDGTFEIVSDGDEDSNVFTYTVEDADGNTDTAYVTVTTGPGLACFVAGTLIETVEGPVAVEELEPGTRVLTRDNGPQPVRWIGRSQRVAEGSVAPIVFEPGALGNHGQVALSPNHRVLVSSVQAELLFGQAEVLIKAKLLVNDRTVRPRADGRPVTYLHLLFDQHEIVTGNGLESESYHPGDETLAGFDAETQEEVLDLMPALASRDLLFYGPAARRELKAHEAQVLLSP